MGAEETGGDGAPGQRTVRGDADKSVTNSPQQAHGVKMPTNFTVVPVKDCTRKTAKDNQKEEDDNNVLREEDEEATGEVFQCPLIHCLQLLCDMCSSLKVVHLGGMMGKVPDLAFWHVQVNPWVCLPWFTYILLHSCS